MSCQIILKSLFVFLFVVNSGYANTILVTCATGELGSQIAEVLALDNDLILMGRDAAKLAVLQQKLSSQFSKKYSTLPLDFRDMPALQKSISSLKGPLNGLVLIPPRPTFSSNPIPDSKEWADLFQIMFIGPVELLREAEPLFVTGTKIVMIGGTTSVQILPGYSSACVIRRMLATYSKSLSHLLGARGISVNMVSPGVVFTNFHKTRIAKKANDSKISFEEQLAKETATIPFKRFVEPIEVARSVQFLLSSKSDGITGVNLVVDGGATVCY